MNSETVTLWLNSIGKDREWLAQKLDKSLGTLKNWFSQGFPQSAQTVIKVLMEADRIDDEPNAILPIRFTWQELEMLHFAASAVGMGLEEFVKASLREEAQSQDLNIRVAEEPAPYKATPMSLVYAMKT